MLTIKEKLYFKFRPKLEKNLYEIIKQGETSVSLDTVLYDFFMYWIQVCYLYVL